MRCAKRNRKRRVRRRRQRTSCAALEISRADYLRHVAREIEDAKPEWIEAGGNVLFQAMLAKANELPVVGKSRETVAVA